MAMGFALGSIVSRREPVKSFFNVSSMTLATAVAMLAIEALGGGTSGTWSAIAAVTAGMLVFALVNRLLVATVLALVGAGSLRENLLDDLPARALLLAANVAIGLLAGLAARDDVWVLPLGLVAIVVLHYALAGHGRAKAEHQKLENIVNASSNGILTIDRQGNIASWSDACAEITGYTAAEVIGKAFPTLSNLLEAERIEFPEPDRGRRYRIRIHRKDGDPRWLDRDALAPPRGRRRARRRRRHDPPQLRGVTGRPRRGSHVVGPDRVRLARAADAADEHPGLHRDAPDPSAAGGGAHALPRHHRRPGTTPRVARGRPPEPAHARRGGPRAASSKRWTCARCSESRRRRSRAS